MLNIRLVSIFAVIFLSVNLAGCNDSSETRLKKDTEAAAQNPDAWDAYLKLNKSVDVHRLESKSPFSSIEETSTFYDYKKLAMETYTRALRQGSQKALIDLFSRERSLFDSLDEFRQEYASKIIAAADSSDGNKEDAALLFTAAKVIQEGRWVNKDSYHASALYAQAWLAGSIRAPSELYSLFDSINDPASAYLWAVRCIGKCELSPSNVASRTESKLSLRQIIRIQKESTNTSVITLNGLAEKEVLK